MIRFTRVSSARGDPPDGVVAKRVQEQRGAHGSEGFSPFKQHDVVSPIVEGVGQHKVIDAQQQNHIHADTNTQTK